MRGRYYRRNLREAVERKRRRKINVWYGIYIGYEK